MAAASDVRGHEGAGGRYAEPWQQGGGHWSAWPRQQVKPQASPQLSTREHLTPLGIPSDDCSTTAQSCSGHRHRIISRGCHNQIPGDVPASQAHSTLRSQGQDADSTHPLCAENITFVLRTSTEQVPRARERIVADRNRTRRWHQHSPRQLVRFSSGTSWKDTKMHSRAQMTHNKSRAHLGRGQIGRGTTQQGVWRVPARTGGP